jgi:hypothetical protein
MNDLNISTPDSNSIPQCRNTDPQTSRLAKKSDTLNVRIIAALQSYGPQTCWELVQTLNAMREGASHDPDSPPREITIDSVSTQMRPLCRKGLVHEDGTKLNTVRDTGNRVIMWAHGPSKDWRGTPMPPVATGPQKSAPKFTPFTKEEIIKWNEQCGYADIFTEFLNQQVLLRIS